MVDKKQSKNYKIKLKEWEIINTITIETIEKNSKYKLIHYKGSYYIIDLNRNKLTYIFHY